jgi:putrescine transport system ATP-binding protein
VDADQDRPLNESAQPIIAIRGVTRRFGETAAVDDITLDVGRGDFFCLLGASGCGKTTLMRMIAGLDEPNSGRITIDGEDMTHRPAWRRPVNMMFQSYALFPHLTAAANVAFGLKEEGRPRAEIRERVHAALDLLDMGALAARKPHQLSGGQKQRVALARALVKQPKILLLDEPLAALDKKLRERAQLELVRLRERTGITFVMVTHDQEEAMAMATRIALMHAGKVVQVGGPHELYEAPRSRYVADFFGAANLFEGRVKEVSGNEALIESTESGTSLRARCHEKLSEGASVTVMLRPEQLRLGRDAPGQKSLLRGRIDSVAFLGSFYTCRLTLPTGKVVVAQLSPAEFAAAGSPGQGDTVQIVWLSSSARVLTQ